jgi:hypothetical protein
MKVYITEIDGPAEPVPRKCDAAQLGEFREAGRE